MGHSGKEGEMIRLICFLAVFAAGFPEAFCQVYVMAGGTARFQTSAETFGVDSRFEGSGSGLNGKLNLTDGTLSFSFDLKKLQTGIKLRDSHMHEDYLETETYPTATFTGKVVKGKDPGTLVAQGEFSLHGVKKPVTITGSLSGTFLKAEWKLNLKDFNIEIPEKFMIGKISEVLAMSAEGKLKEVAL